jgi:hypothetical protein
MATPENLSHQEPLSDDPHESIFGNIVSEALDEAYQKLLRSGQPIIVGGPGEIQTIRGVVSLGDDGVSEVVTIEVLETRQRSGLDIMQ